MGRLRAELYALTDSPTTAPVAPRPQGASSLPEHSLGLAGCFLEEVQYRPTTHPVCCTRPSQNSGTRAAAQDQQVGRAAASASRCAALQMRQLQGLAFALERCALSHGRRLRLHKTGADTHCLHPSDPIHRDEGLAERPASRPPSSSRMPCAFGA